MLLYNSDLGQKIKVFVAISSKKRVLKIPMADGVFKKTLQLFNKNLYLSPDGKRDL